MLSVLHLIDITIINPFPPRAAKSGHFVILLCLTPDDLTRQRRAPGWERPNLLINFLRCINNTM